MKFSKVAIVLALATTASAKLVAPTQSNQTLANTKIDIMSNGTEVSTADFSKNDTQALIHASTEAKLEFDKIKHLKAKTLQFIVGTRYRSSASSVATDTNTRIPT